MDYRLLLADISPKAYFAVRCLVGPYWGGGYDHLLARAGVAWVRLCGAISIEVSAVSSVAPVVVSGLLVVRR
ncbi:MAG: hypothetical protein QGG42_01595 [Phycisphaerae bacterium]|nr:hypothetical protein [Phycisphaerae bacterium]